MTARRLLSGKCFLALVVVCVTQISGSRFLDLRFHLNTRTVPKVCTIDTNSKSCNLSYAVVVYESFGSFDLESSMLQEGKAMNEPGKRHFWDDTVVRIPRKTLELDEKVYLGVKFFDLPSNVQDYFVIDATRAAHPNSHEPVKLTLGSNGLQFAARIMPGRVEYGRARNGCSCANHECSCCEHLSIKKIHLDDIGCVNITYVPKDYGFLLTFSVNGHVYYTEEMSARNPPPVCFAVPDLKEFASLCLKFHDMDLSDKHFSGCVKLEAELYHMRIAEHELGCFHIPV